MEMMEENSSVSEIMTYFNIFLLSWEDIWLVEILPKLNLEDLFRFRGTCKQAYELVNIYFSRLKKVDLTDKRSFNLEHYKVCKFCKFFLKSFPEKSFLNNDFLKIVSDCGLQWTQFKIFGIIWQQIFNK